MKTTYRVEFEFVPNTSNGDLIHRTVDVIAESPRVAVKDAWQDRGRHFGGFGVDNAINCRVV